MTFGWRDWTRGQWLLRSVVLLGPLLALLARWPSDPPGLRLVLLTLAVAAGWTVAPESFIGACCLLVVGFSWASGLRSGLPVGAVAAAVAMLAAHLAALVASYGPDALPVSGRVVRLWMRRGVAVALVAPLVWVVALAVRDVPGSGTVWVVGLAVALSLTVVAGVVTQAGIAAEEG